MKLLFALIFTLIPLTAAEPQPTGGSKLPPGAVQAADGSYRFTDPQGKSWIYRPTPFGMARAEEIRTTATSVTEAGDVIRFERRTPFGVVKWEQKSPQRAQSAQAPEASQASQGSQKD